MALKFKSVKDFETLHEWCLIEMLDKFDKAGLKKLILSSKKQRVVR